MKKHLLNFGLILVSSAALFTACKKTEDPTPAAKTTTGTTGTTGTTTPVPDATFLASKTPSNRIGLLEDFTGVRCVFCPDGHSKATEAATELGADKFIILAVHGGSYAAPATGWANFTTPFGAALISQSSVAGYPAGTINRVLATDLGVTPQKTGGIAMSRGSWKTAAQAILAMPSPVNAGAKAEFNSQTRELKINLDLYYTADETSGNNINVAFVQSQLLSKQSGGSDPYVQNHVLRHLLTGQWGEVITTPTTKDAKVSKTYTYTVPEHYNGITVEGGGAVVIENCEVVVFVSRGKTDILTAIKVPVTVK
jgi:hypothetical protein